MQGKTTHDDKFITPPPSSAKAPKGESIEAMAKRLGFKYKKQA
jgi:hypothetical protein